MPQDSSRKEGENGESANDYMEIDPASQQTFDSRHASGNAGAVYRCSCGRMFQTSKGLKIHGRRMDCVPGSERRTAASEQTDKTSSVTGQDANHSLVCVSSSSPGSSPPRPRIKFPSSRRKTAWNELDACRTWFDTTRRYGLVPIQYRQGHPSDQRVRPDP